MKNLVYKIFSLKPLQILIILFITASVVGIVKYFGISEQSQIIRVEVKGKGWSEDSSKGDAYLPPSWLTKNISIGDIEKNASGKEIARIVGIEEYGDVKPTLILLVNIKGIANNKTKKFSFKNKSLSVGSKIEFAFPKVDLIGQITDLSVPENGYLQKNIVIKGRYRTVEPWIINQIKIGDKMINQKSKQSIAEITQIEIEPSVSSIFYVTPNYYSNTFLVNNQRVKDLVITLEIKLQELKDGWRFAGNQIVKTGQTINLTFSNYNIGSFEIQDLHDENTSN